MEQVLESLKGKSILAKGLEPLGHLRFDGHSQVDLRVLDPFHAFHGQEPGDEADVG